MKKVINFCDFCGKEVNDKRPALMTTITVNGVILKQVEVCEKCLRKMFKKVVTEEDFNSTFEYLAASEKITEEETEEE